MLAAIERTDIDATDDGLASARRELERMCVVTREVRPVSEMIRFVAGPDGTAVPDIERKLPGRGAWIVAKRAAVERAVREKTLTRAFRGKASATLELPVLIERLLEKSALEGLSLANKAALVVTGTIKVQEALAAGEVALLLHASDASPDGIRKLDGAARAAEMNGLPPVPVNRAFRGEQLDLALGRSNVVHAALLAHPAGAGFLGRCLRLERWRKGETAGPVSIADPK